MARVKGKLQPEVERTPIPDPGPAPSRRLHLNLESLRAGRLLPEATQEQRLTEDYRRIKRPILDRLRTLTASRTDGGHMIMVASALPGDGKSFTSLNLALSITREVDVPVLLADTDVFKRHLTCAMGLDKRLGLLDALADHTSDVESYVIPTDHSRLSILPAGLPRQTAAEMLASVRMVAVAANLHFADPYRVVVLDSPPLLLSSEARAIAGFVGQVVLVVRSGVTPQAAVREALEGIQEDKLAGIVFNESRPIFDGDHYGYGYGYYNTPKTSQS